MHTEKDTRHETEMAREGKGNKRRKMTRKREHGNDK